MLYLYIIHSLFSFLAIYLFIKDYNEYIKNNYIIIGKIFILLLCVTPILNIILISEVIKDE